MKGLNKLFYLLLTVSILLFISSCNNITGSTENGNDLEDSLNPVEDVVPVEGGENSTITVHKASDTYFNLEFSDIQSNSIIGNGAGEGWCIDWQKPIDSDGGTYHGVKLYSTFNVKKWNQINYLFNIIEDLKSNDPEITGRDIQIVIWSLRGNPEFNVDTVSVDDLPARMRSNGEANFDKDRVKEILDIINAGYEDFDFTEGTRFAVIAETPADVQTVITVVE
jgi:hypothetical protein